MFDGIAKFEVQVKPEDLDELNHVNNVVENISSGMLPEQGPGSKRICASGRFSARSASMKPALRASA